MAAFVARIWREFGGEFALEISKFGRGICGGNLVKFSEIWAKFLPEICGEISKFQLNFAREISAKFGREISSKLRREISLNFACEIPAKFRRAISAVRAKGD